MSLNPRIDNLGGHFILSPQGALMQMIVPPLGMVVASGLVSLLSGGNGLMMLGKIGRAHV